MSRSIYRSPEGEKEVRERYRHVLENWPGPKSELRLPTREGETFVLASGEEHAPPVVLLHGAQANAAAWMFDLPLWSRAFRCYAVDLIGEAGFSAPSRPPLNGEAHALWLDDVLKGLGLDHASFIGVSLGGWLALDYARHRPEAVERLALLCPAGIGRQKNFLLKVAPLLLLGNWGARRIRGMVFGPSQGDPPPPLRPFVELMSSIGRNIRPRMVAIPRLSDAELSALAMPILAIVGGRDVLIDSNDTRRRLESSAPNAEIVFLPEERHAIFGQSERIFHFLLGSTAGAAA